ncbi:MAG: sulfatase-like hydrolase/transferase [Planctomycetota bacterium]|nr:sulfatase-like hydrolase/transferase [Planctomycetota bacterium]
MRRLLTHLSVSLLGLPGLADAQDGTPKANVLILMADDLGVDYISAYKEGSNPAPTPNIDALAKRGVLFRNAWANPLCSPTRACILTGRYGFRTGVGTIIASRRSQRSGGLRADELSLPELLDRAKSGYAHALIGKWHLGGSNRAPNEVGWSHFAGILPGTLRPPNTYSSWPRTVDGETERSSAYTTTQFVDDALAWIRRSSAQGKPWLCFVNFNAPHSPFHVPPEDLHTVTIEGPASRRNRVACYRAMVQAMDQEIGRLLAQLGDDLRHTNVIFLGDNGTPGQIAQEPFAGAQAKGSVYEGGVNVPLIVAGPAVAKPGRESKALVGAVDLYATVAELCGVDIAQSSPAAHHIDGVSFIPHLRTPGHAPVRSMVFTELFQGDRPNEIGRAAIRDSRYKVIRRYRRSLTPKDRFFDLEQDPFERRDLARRDKTDEQAASFKALQAELDRLRK